MDQLQADIMNMTGFSVVGGTAGASSPWLNQGGTFSSAFDAATSSLAGASKDLTAKTQTLLQNIPGAEGMPSTTGQPSTATSGFGNLGAGVGTLTDAIDKYFIRGVIVILGFIFVAAGLALFGKGTPIVEAVVKTASKVSP